MDPARASMTALGAAYRRAYHDAYDTPKVFENPFAALFVSPDEATYKLDLGGKTPKEYAEAVKAGKVPALPVDLELVLTNNRKTPVRAR